jgi:hypothetical protein
VPTETDDSVIRRLTEIKAAQPADATLRNLIEVLQMKLELSARLPLLVLEAEHDGDHAGARVFQTLVTEEKSQIAALLDGLRHHLDSMHTDVLSRLSPGTRTPQVR